MSKMYDTKVVIVSSECVNEALQIGMTLAKQGFEYLLHYRSGVFIATTEEIPEEDDHTQYPLVPTNALMEEILSGNGLITEDYPESYNVCLVHDIYTISI